MNITKLGFKNETFDLAYSLFDVLNYLNTEDFNKFLNDLKYITKNKGFIALDFLTPLAFYDTDKNPDSIQIGEDFYYISKTNKISEELVNLDLTAFIKYRDDLYKKISEHHKLNLLNTTRIIKKLKDKDFTVKNVYDGEEIKEADENSWHVIIIAQNNA
jgi:ubiquinone/menaquinone biosynthesis C-methylase UbiE